MHELIENSDEVIKKAYNELEAHNWTNEELRAYEASEKIAKDAKSREKYIEQTAREEGERKGREEGEKSKTMEIARNLINQRLDIKLIAKSTGLSEADVEKLKEKL